MDVYGIALILPDKIGKELDRLRNGYKKEMYFIPIPHITLIHPFIPKISLKLMTDRLSQIAERTKQFTLALSGIEYSNGKTNKALIGIVNKQAIMELYRAITAFIIGPLKDAQGNLILDTYSPELIIGQNIPEDILSKMKQKLAKETVKYEIEIDTFGIFVRNPEFSTNQEAEWSIVERFAMTG